MFMVVQIDDMGYISHAPFYHRRRWIAGDTRDSGYNNVVHKESRNLQHHFSCVKTLAEAKAEWEGANSDQVILALTDEGAGCELWVPRSREQDFRTRLQRFAGCYGSWPIRVFND